MLFSTLSTNQDSMTFMTSKSYGILFQQYAISNKISLYTYKSVKEYLIVYIKTTQLLPVFKTYWSRKATLKVQHRS